MMSCNVFRFFVGNAEIAKKKKKGGGNGRVWVFPTWVIVFSPSSCSVIIFRWLQLREILIMPNCFQLFGFWFFFFFWCGFNVFSPMHYVVRSVYTYIYIYLLYILADRAIDLTIITMSLCLSLSPPCTFYRSVSLAHFTAMETALIGMLLLECYL